LRNEAHRFAITFHRDQRSKNALGTELTQIKGVGEKTAQKLLSQYGSVKKLSLSQRISKIKTAMNSVVIKCGLLILLFSSCKEQPQNILPIFSTPNVELKVDNIRKVLDADIFYDSESKPFSGYVVNTGEKPKFKLSISEGKLHGEQLGWHSNGSPAFKYTCVEGERENIYQEYYPSGKVHIQSEYENGVEISKTVRDLSGQALVNYVIKDGRYYGLLGSSDCMTIFDESGKKALKKK